MQAWAKAIEARPAGQAAASEPDAAEPDAAAVPVAVAAPVFTSAPASADARAHEQNPSPHAASLHDAPSRQEDVPSETLPPEARLAERVAAARIALQAGDAGPARSLLDDPSAGPAAHAAFFLVASPVQQSLMLSGLRHLTGRSRAGERVSAIASRSPAHSILRPLIGPALFWRLPTRLAARPSSRPASRWMTAASLPGCALSRLAARMKMRCGSRCALLTGRLNRSPPSSRWPTWRGPSTQPWRGGWCGPLAVLKSRPSKGAAARICRLPIRPELPAGSRPLARFNARQRRRKRHGGCSPAESPRARQGRAAGAHRHRAPRHRSPTNPRRTAPHVRACR